MKSISQCRKERCDRLRSRVLEMSHEDRLKLANRKRAHGVGMIVAGLGCFVGLAAGLWGSMGGGAVGVGIGAASALWASSYGSFDMSKNILLWDEEISQGGV